MFCSLIRSIRDKIRTGWAHSGIKKIVDSTLHVCFLVSCYLKYCFHWTFTFSPTNPISPLLHKRFQVLSVFVLYITGVPVPFLTRYLPCLRVRILRTPQTALAPHRRLEASWLVVHPTGTGVIHLVVLFETKTTASCHAFQHSAALQVVSCPFSESVQALNILSHHCCEETLTPLTGDWLLQDFVQGKMFTSCNFTQLYHFAEVRSAVQCQTPFFFHRKILKDLSSEDTRDRKGDEESPGVSTVTSMSVPTPIYQTSTGQYSTLPKISSQFFFNSPQNTDFVKYLSKMKYRSCLLSTSQ